MTTFSPLDLLVSGASEMMHSDHTVNFWLPLPRFSEMACNYDFIFDHVETFLITFDTPPIAWESIFLFLGTSEHGVASLRLY
jgi:hypothetical protein